MSQPPRHRARTDQGRSRREADDLGGSGATRPSFLRRAGRVVGVAGGGAALLSALAIGLFPTQTFLNQRASTAEAEERLAVLRAQNEAFEARIDRLNTDDEIERVAREQYNLAYPGEETYAVLPAPLPPLEMPAVWPFGEILDPVATSPEVDAELDQSTSSG